MTSGIPSRSAIRCTLLLAGCVTAAATARVLAGEAKATPAVQQPQAPLAVPANTANAASYSDFIMLTVDKANLRAELKTWPEDPAKATSLRSFKIATGKADGDKLKEGDNRTPEGIYFAQSHIGGGALPEKYGSLAIPIDFPNPIDLLERKTGHGIWLHGVDREQRIEEAKVTEGCVAFYNSDIARLSNWLLSHQGIVVIASDAKQVNVAKDMDEVRKYTIDWMTAWQNRNVEAYVANYATDFRFEKHDYKSYIEYKKRVFASYKTMTVKFDNLRVISHPKYAVSFFNQDFQGDNRFASVGRKILYWERQADGGWKIKREVFENRRFEFVKFTDAERALLSDTASSMSPEGDKKSPNL